jgi:hypothetical protein
MVANNLLEPAQEAGRAMILNEQKSMTMSDKQALKRQYFEAKTRAGVYAIRNQITGRALVAGSTNIQGTLNRHRFELRFGQHRNVRLAQNWDGERAGQCFTSWLDYGTAWARGRRQWVARARADSLGAPFSEDDVRQWMNDPRHPWRRGFWPTQPEPVASPAVQASTGEYGTHFYK